MERRMTPQEEVESRYNHSGVVVFIFDSKGRILVTREREEKETAFERGAIRKTDQLGVITETGEKGENWQTTLFRGLKEELGLDPQNVCNCLKLRGYNLYIGETLFLDGVLATVVQIHCPDTGKLFKNIEANKDLDILGFFPVQTFLNSQNVRFGVNKVLGECVNDDNFATK